MNLPNHMQDKIRQVEERHLDESSTFDMNYSFTLLHFTDLPERAIHKWKSKTVDVK